MNGRRSTGAILLLALLALALLTGAQRSGSWDLFFHLATGREILRQRSTLPQDIFSFTAAGHPWRYKDLVADVVLYLGFSRLGYAALALLKSLCALGVGLGLWLATDPARSRPRALPWLCATVLLLAALQYRFIERPLLFSLALFPICLGLWQRARRRLLGAEVLTPRALAGALLPPVLLAWLWLQVHREALVGLALPLGFAAYLGLAALVAGRLPRLLPRASLRSAGAAALAGLLGLALAPLNPCGLVTLTSTFAVGQSRFYRQYVMDWRALPPLTLLREFPAAGGLTLLAALALLVVVLRRQINPPADAPQGGPALSDLAATATGAAAGPDRADLWHAGLLGLFLVLTLGSSRYLPYLASAAALALLAALPELLARPTAPPAGRRVGLLVLLGVGGAALLRVASPHALGVGPVPDHFPEGALRFALQHGLRERVANAVELGGYVHWAGWPRLRVAIDGRMDTVYTPEELRRGLGAQTGARTFAALRREDGADWVLAANEFGVESHLFLARDPAWALVYWSEAAAVLVRRDAYPALAPLAFAHFDRAAPFPAIERAAALVRREPERLAPVEAELQRLVEASPQGLLSRSLLLLFYHRVGPARAAQRDRLLAALQAEQPDHPVVLGLPRLLAGGSP